MVKKGIRAKLETPGDDAVQKPINLGLRKVMKSRTSKAMTLPKIWTNSNGVEVGDKVEVIMELNGTLSVRKVIA